jgi:DnaK suppressor protein
MTRSGDSKNLTKAAQKAFRTTLENRQAELVNGNRKREDLAIETSSDELDRIQHASARDYAMNHLERTSNRLREVRSALRRLDAGTFGICAGCDASIHAKRLAAVPWALLCVVCQEAADCEQTTPHEEIDMPLLMTA